MPSKVSPRRKACLLSISLFIFHYKITPSLSPYANKQHTHTQIQKCTKCTTRTLSLSLSLQKNNRERECVSEMYKMHYKISLSLYKNLSPTPKGSFPQTSTSENEQQPLVNIPCRSDGAQNESSCWTQPASS